MESVPSIKVDRQIAMVWIEGLCTRSSTAEFFHSINGDRQIAMVWIGRLCTRCRIHLFHTPNTILIGCDCIMHWSKVIIEHRHLWSKIGEVLNPSNHNCSDFNLSLHYESFIKSQDVFNNYITGKKAPLAHQQR